MKRNASELTPPFRPAWYCRGRHLQSVWGYFLRKHPRVDWRRERWDTPDGDFLDVDFLDPLDAGEPDAPTLLVLHGLEGSSDSHYVRGAAAGARKRGWRTLAMNYRSCGGAPNRKPRFYHCGETGDPGFVVGRILERFSGPLVLAGFSLGGNVLLKWLGECGDGVSPRIRGAACVSASLRPAACAKVLDSVPGYFYRWHLLGSVKQKAERFEQLHPGLIDIEGVRRARTFHYFDRLVIAPLYGFRDELDYYEQADASPWLPHIRVKTLILAAADDPIVPAHVFPHAQVEENKWLRGELVKKGGHVGFVSGGNPRAPLFWAEERAFGFLEDCLRA